MYILLEQYVTLYTQRLADKHYTAMTTCLYQVHSTAQHGKCTVLICIADGAG
jgi:hypothetical protein